MGRTGKGQRRVIRGLCVALGLMLTAGLVLHAAGACEESPICFDALWGGIPWLVLALSHPLQSGLHDNLQDVHPYSKKPPKAHRGLDK